MMNNYICVHGHFYQPPRENPWLERIEQQDSAYPFHDWNERINAECYEPNTASRILSEDGKIIDIINNYSRISFNFGPTLLSWIEHTSPGGYKAILEADKLSQKRFSGHGSALAQVYNHMIMPLANLRDKKTQVLWGIRDFEYRFHRKPEGMWLAETAVDTETLEVLADFGIRFTILSPYQAAEVCKTGTNEWYDVNGGKVDPRRPYLCKLPSGNDITLFFYDGQASNDVAFRGLLKNGKKFADRIMNIFDKNNNTPQLAHIATDGESYGHHHRFGDMALAFCLHYIESKQKAKLTIYSEYLEHFPPDHQVKIHENTSWSCAHGVERWKSNCGCKSTGDPDITQEWRAPLRNALDWLRDELIKIYEKTANKLLLDSWKARDDYIKVILNRSPEMLDQFFQDHTVKDIQDEEKILLLRLMEIQRHAMLMYTSCGWFFDDISGIEAVQILKYASRAIQLTEDIDGISLENKFIEKLKKAPSNFSEFGNGALIYEKHVKPSVVSLTRVGAHYAISSLFKDYLKNIRITEFNANSLFFDKMEAGRQTLAIGKTIIKSNITHEEMTLSSAIIHLGDHNIIGGVRESRSDEKFSQMYEEIKKTFKSSDISKNIQVLDKYFGRHNFSFWHLFRDEQISIINQLIDEKLGNVENTFRRIFKDNYHFMNVMKNLGISIPRVLSVSGQFSTNNDLYNALNEKKPDIEKIQDIAEEIKHFTFGLDKTTMGFKISNKLNDVMNEVYESPGELSNIQFLDELFSIFNDFKIDLDIWKAQNIYFFLWKKKFPGILKKAEDGEENAQKWIDHFNNLGVYLNVKIN